MYTSSFKPNTRIDVVDVLRGIAIAGILLVHSIEKYNLYYFPETNCTLLKFLDVAAFQGLFQFLLAGKMYAIFAMLFGISFFVQNDNQEQKGKNFGGRFAWRMVLLLGFGLLNSVFYNGDILALYAVCGLFLIPMRKLDTKVVFWIMLFFAIQPVEWYYVIRAAFNPEWSMPMGISGKFFSMASDIQTTGTFWEITKYNLTGGLVAAHGYSVDHGRITQTLFLFLLGLILGRKRRFYNEGNNKQFWIYALVIGVAAFFPLYGMRNTLPEYLPRNVMRPLSTILNMWSNAAFATIIVSSIVLLYYHTNLQPLLHKLAPYGKMSLTNYIGQGIIGSILFFGWGFGLYTVCGGFYSLLIGLCIFVGQYIFCKWWLKHHTHGPLEGLWRTLTWI